MIYNSVLREPFKYYFADFVRKWGTPPIYGFFPEKIFFKKC